MQANQELIERLVDSGVEFVIVGGFAAVVHGVTLITKDLDLCISRSEKNFGAILKAFEGIHPAHKLIKKTIPLEATVEKLKRYKNLYLTTDIGFIDLLGTIAGLGIYEEVLPHTIEIDLYGRKCKVLDIKSLIKSKKEIGTPKDKQAILQLEAIGKDPL